MTLALKVTTYPRMHACVVTSRPGMKCLIHMDIQIRCRKGSAGTDVGGVIPGSMKDPAKS